MPDVDGKNKAEELRRSKEAEAFERKLGISVLMNTLKAEGAEIINNDDMPFKQMGQLYRAQHRLHNGSDDEYWTLLGQVTREDSQKRLQINGLAKEAIKHAPDIISQHWSNEIKKIDEPRGAIDAQGFADRLVPYVYKEDAPTGYDPKIDEAFTGYCKVVWDKMAMAYNTTGTPLGDFLTWKTQFTSGTNSGDPKFESLTKEQWVKSYIPELMGAARSIAAGEEPDLDPMWTRGHYTLFGRTPDRPVHGVHMLGKMVGAKLGYDIGLGLSGGKYPHIAWMSLEQMLEYTASAMSHVECTIHEDFKWFDAFVGTELAMAVLNGLKESNFLKSQPENRNILIYLLTELTNPTWIRIAPHYLMKMKAGLYSGTPVTQIFGSVVHSAYIEMLRHERGVGIKDYFVLSDDGMCTFEGDAVAGRKVVVDEMMPLAEEIGMKISDEKSYVADITERRTMFAGEEKLVRHDVGPFLQKYPQLDPDEAFGNIPRLIRSTMGRERDFDRESHEMLFNLLPGLRLTERGERSQMTSWVTDFWRTLEVLAQVRPGYPRVRKLIYTYTKVYPEFWKKFDKLITAAEATGDKLFDTRLSRGGGQSDKGTTRWLVNYLLSVRETDSWPPIPEH